MRDWADAAFPDADRHPDGDVVRYDTTDGSVAVDCDPDGEVELVRIAIAEDTGELDTMLG